MMNPNKTLGSNNAMPPRLLDRGECAAQPLRQDTLTSRLCDRADMVRREHSTFAEDLDSLASQVTHLHTILFGPDSAATAMKVMCVEQGPTEAPAEFMSHSFTDAAFTLSDLHEQFTRQRRAQFYNIRGLVTAVINALNNGN